MRQNPLTYLLAAFKSWFIPQSSDPTVRYRERALRFLLPIISILRILAINNNYSGKSGIPTPFAPLWVPLTVFIIPVIFSFIFLIQNKINQASATFLLHWYLTDLLSLPAEGYWYPGFQISLIIQVIIGTLLLPSKAIIPSLFFQILTVGIWGKWLDMNYFKPPFLSTGEPISVFQTAFNILAGQETIIMFLIRYLRLEMEKSLRIQQSNIEQLQNEITERHIMEVERENFIKELNKKNAELERFTYTVSHDLKSPLVTIKGFLGFLKKDLETNRGDQIQKDLSRIEEATIKMGILLSELLELSRIGRIINQPVQVDLVKLTEETLEILNGRIREQNIKVIVSPDLPRVYADRPRLAEVLENLIDNAAKYMGEQPKPLVEIGSFQVKNEIVIYVRDNGIGIESKYHTKIFGLFEKLDSTSEGTGIGLALVKRIIETHGGRIWVESEGLGKGSTFCFTIPSKQ
ncbi:MAG: ATP-binding protein [Anaerolineales bacterium]